MEENFFSNLSNESNSTSSFVHQDSKMAMESSKLKKPLNISQNEEKIIYTLNEQNDSLLLASWEEVLSFSSNICLEAFWDTLIRWSIFPTYIFKSVKRFDLNEIVCLNSQGKPIYSFFIQNEEKEEFSNKKQKLNNEEINEVKRSEKELENEEDQVIENQNTQNIKKRKYEQDEYKEIYFFSNHLESKLKSIWNGWIDENTEQLIIKRHLYPRVSEKDNEIDELITFYKHQYKVEFKVIFPNPESRQPSYLPFYYAKVQGYAFIYQDIDLEAKKLKLEVIYFNPTSYQNQMKKIAASVLKKLHNWGTRFTEGFSVIAVHDIDISVNDYYSMYNSLKKKYKHWVGKWKGLSDPQKVVFEDIGIASFLICLWNLERSQNQSNKKQSFVDLGCGNGFLVYILCKEGYDGKGIDMEKRPMWDEYEKEYQDRMYLQTFNPMEATFPEADWILGNHADELTPWIPLIASKTLNTRYFILPCCFFDFVGKYSETDPKIGKFKTYLNYLKKIGEKCGFKVESETLKIPSTKNQAQIGRFRNSSISKEEIEENRKSLLINFPNFIPREKAGRHK